MKRSWQVRSDLRLSYAVPLALAAVALVLQGPACAADVLFRPYQNRTAIAGVAMQAPPCELAKKLAGVEFSLVQGPQGMTVDPRTGAPKWPSPTEGRHVVRVKAAVGDDWDQLEWVVRVLPNDSPNLTIVSTEHVDFVVPQQYAEWMNYWRAQRFVDALWETEAAIVGLELCLDRRAIRLDPSLSPGRGQSGNPITSGRGTFQVDPVRGWLLGLCVHELGHGFNVVLQWKRIQQDNWAGGFLHAFGAVYEVIIPARAMSNPAAFGLPGPSLANYRQATMNFRRSVAQEAVKYETFLKNGGKSEAYAVVTEEHQMYLAFCHLLQLICDQHGPQPLEDMLRLMRPGVLPDEVYDAADNATKKNTLFICMLSCAAKKDLRSLFAPWGFQTDPEYLKQVTPQVIAALKSLPRDGWNDGWVYCPATGSDYRLLPTKTDWAQADRAARQHGAALVELNSAEEHAFVWQRFSPAGAFWLGMSDEDGDGKWTWNSGKPMAYTNWAATQPASTTPRRYAVTYKPDGAWSRRDGLKPNAVVIERPHRASGRH